MAIQFNDTTAYKGLVQFYEQEIGATLGDVSGNPTLLKQFTARVNLALDKYFSLAIGASGKWQLDDSNHSGYPIITTNLVAGQRDYPFTTDSSGNAILDIYKVLVKNTTTGVYQEIYPVDVQSDCDTQSFTDGLEVQGTVYRYDKTANSIFLDSVPQNSVTAGLKVYINRDSSYFTYTDTTRKPGYPYHQEYFFLKPAYEIARINGLASAYARLEKEIFKLEGDPTNGVIGLIAKAYGARARDEEPIVFCAEEINSV